jgi:dephospho-CoA kinase
MIHIAVTGGIACGKSLVGYYLKDSGFAVADTDTIAHQVLKEGSEGARAVINVFGRDILKSNSDDIDRKKLSDIVFSHPDKLALLEKIVHPKVAELVEKFLKFQDSKEKNSVVVVPLLFEAGFERGWDYIICISSFLEVQLDRLEKRNIDREIGLKIIKSQLDDYSKRRKSDYVILNNGTKKTLKKQIDIVLSNIMEKHNVLQRK